MRKRALLLVVLSALLQTLVFPSVNWYWLCWIAFVPWLVALLASEGKNWRSIIADTLIGWSCGVLWYLGTCYWIYHAMRTHGGLSLPAALLVLILFALYLGLYHALFAFLVSFVRVRGASVRLLIISAPILWTAVELARSRVTSFPWDLLGYAQVDNIPLTRIATVTGVFGISFVVMLVNAAITGGLLLRSRGVALLITGIAAAVVFQSGTFERFAPFEGSHTAVLVQQDLPLEYPDQWTEAYFDSTITDLIQTSEPKLPPAAQGQSRLIIWPESPAPFFANDPRFDRWMATLASDSHSYVIAGSIFTSGSGADRQLYDSATLFSPTDGLQQRYDKVHLVPFGEFVPFSDYFAFAKELTRQVGTFTHGYRREVLDADDVKAGTFICYESIFPDEVRQFVRSGANVLVNVSDDGWFGETGAPGQHLRMARMRAIENDRWLLRSTNNGITAVVDPLGRDVASAPRNVRTAIVAHFEPIPLHRTFYTQHGDWFSYACAILTIVILIIRLKGAPA